MNLLLDTNVWLLGYLGSETLPEEIRLLLDSATETFGLSAISLWEVGSKNQIGKLELKSELGAWLKEGQALKCEVAASIAGSSTPG